MIKTGNEQETISSQKSPKMMLVVPSIKDIGNYTRMFLEDFCCFTALEDRLHNSELLEINDNNLRKLLCYEDPKFLRYGLVQQFNQVAKMLLLYGKAYVEVITEKNTDSKLVGISFRLINTNRVRTICNHVYFKARAFDESVISFSIPKSNLMIFDLKELGFSRRFFAHLFRKMQKLDPPFDLIGTKDFDLKQFEAYSDKVMLKLNRRTYWFGRHYSNQFMSEAYLLYHRMKFKEMQWRFLEYFISKYNETLLSITDEEKIKGVIVVNGKKPDCALYMSRLKHGDLNFEQLSNIISQY